MYHFPQIPRFIFLPIVLLTGLRWIFLYSFHTTYKVVKNRAEVVQKTTGLSFWQQYWRVLAISTMHGLSPKAWYDFQLYQTDQKKNLWDYVYDQEVSAFHALRNHGRNHYREHVALLGDKWHFEQHLQSHGIPGANTFALIPVNTDNFLRHLQALAQQYGQIFCKRRQGNQGKGAFSAFLKDGNLCIQPRKKLPLADGECDDFLQKNIQVCDYLIQPEHKNHQNLIAVQQGETQPAITMRIISSCHNQAIRLEFAVLHCPIMEGNKTRFHYPIAIDLSSGTLDKKHPQWPHNNLDSQHSEYLTQFHAILSGETLPFWLEAVELSYRAHLLLQGVDQIAWDFILTEERAVLLEGNSGWGGLAVCQRFGYDATRYMQ